MSRYHWKSIFHQSKIAENNSLEWTFDSIHPLVPWTGQQYWLQLLREDPKYGVEYDDRIQIKRAKNTYKLSEIFFVRFSNSYLIENAWNLFWQVPLTSKRVKCRFYQAKNGHYEKDSYQVHCKVVLGRKRIGRRLVSWPLSSSTESYFYLSVTTPSATCYFCSLCNTMQKKRTQESYHWSTSTVVTVHIVL